MARTVKSPTAPTAPPDQIDSGLASQLAMINKNQTSQVGGIQALGSAQDTNISNIYNNLRGGLQQGVTNTQAIYDRGGQNVRSAYDMGGAQAGAANAGAMSQIADNATRLGMDPRALAEVQGKLATQAGMFANRNQQASVDRSATMAQQGAGMTAISQMAVEAARQAEARGRSDLSKKILTEVAKANSSAMTQKAGATNIAANQSARASARAQAEAASAAKQLMAEQRSMAASRRADASSARADARANRSMNKPTNPLDDLLKRARIEQIGYGIDPNNPRNALQGFKLEDLLGERQAAQGESADDVWKDIYTRFPKHGKDTTATLQKAIAEASKAKDMSGNVARQVIQKSKGLDKQVVLDQLIRLEQAGQRADMKAKKR